jgi:hypothetical protein
VHISNFYQCYNIEYIQLLPYLNNMDIINNILLNNYLEDDLVDNYIHSTIPDYILCNHDIDSIEAYIDSLCREVILQIKHIFGEALYNFQIIELKDNIAIFERKI